jgi:hypothetical protein
MSSVTRRSAMLSASTLTRCRPAWPRPGETAVATSERGDIDENSRCHPCSC